MLEPEVEFWNSISISFAFADEITTEALTAVELFRAQVIDAPDAGSDPVVASVISQPAIFGDPPLDEPPKMAPLVYEWANARGDVVALPLRVYAV